MSQFVGEDESSDAGSNWDSSDDEEVEKKQQEQKKAAAAQTAKKEKGKTKLAQKIKEREEREKKEEALRKMTPEARRALQLKEAEEQEIAGATEFIKIDDPDSIEIGKFKPVSKFHFEQYAEAMSSHLLQFKESPFFVDFIVNVTRDVIRPLKLDDTRKVETVLNVQINDLVKTDRGKKSKKKNKPSMNMGGAKTGQDTRAYGLDDEYDDIYDDM